MPVCIFDKSIYSWFCFAEIMLYSEEIAEEDPYEYLSPTDYVRFSQLQQSSAYGGVPAKQNDLYDEAMSSKGKSVRLA